MATAILIRFDPMKNPPKTANDWLAVLMAEAGSVAAPEEVPHGWMTQKMIAEAQGVPMTTAFSRIERLISAKLMQRKKFRIRCGKLTTAVWHYYKSEK